MRPDQAATVEPDLRMTREEYRAWADQQPRGRYQRMHGVVVAMAPERSEHNDRKMSAWLALHRAVQAAGMLCHVYGDGMTVEVEDSDYEPDVIVHCGPRLPGEAIAVPDPLVIVEVLSPSTSATDRAWKLQEYFRLPSVFHYLIVWADKQQIAHHRRGQDGTIKTSIMVDGCLNLDPPGISIALADIYAT